MHLRGQQEALWSLFLALCLVAVAVPPCSSTILVYNQNATVHQVPIRFDDVPAKDGFGSRIPDEASERGHSEKRDALHCPEPGYLC